MSIEQATTGTIGTRFSQSGETCSVTLQYDPAREAYQLTDESGLLPTVSGLLLTSTEEMGTQWRGEIDVRGAARTVELRTEPHPEAGYEGSIWTLVVHDGEREEYYHRPSFSRKNG